MSNETGRRRPNVRQYITYCYERALPDLMRDWVRNDLGGKGATIRTMLAIWCQNPQCRETRHR